MPMPVPVMTLANATATCDTIVGPVGVPISTVCAVTPNMNAIF